MNLSLPARLTSLVIAAILLDASLMAAEIMTQEAPQRVYFGTYTSGKSRGIYLARFDPASGKLSAPRLVAETTDPSFVALHPSRRWLYAVNETSHFQGQPMGGVSAFSIDGKTGALKLLNQQPSAGTGPCFISVDKSGRCVLVANYNNGSVAAFPIEPDGELGSLGTKLQHEGSSVNPERQAGPHAHFIITDPANRLALACDLGLDKIFVYQLDPSRAMLVANDPPFVRVKPGSGPRHLAFHPNGRFAYLISELASTLTAFAFDESSGAFTVLQTLPTQSEPTNPHNLGAEVQVHPSGRFVYASNRGHDTIATFACDPNTGRLTFIECHPCGGKTPRHFTFSPDGRWMIVENQDSDNIVVFRVDPETGRLTATGQDVELGAPVCSVFAGDAGTEER